MPHESVRAALLHVEEIMERALTPFMVLDDVAKSLYENKPLDAREVDIGIMRKDLTRFGSTTLEMIQPDLEFHKKTAGFDHGSVPVVFWIIDSDMECFKRPDQVFYEVTTFKIPNPFPEYWNKRNYIR